MMRYACQLDVPIDSEAYFISAPSFADYDCFCATAEDFASR